VNYRDLEIWQLAREASVQGHLITTTRLPKFELFESGSQIRRSAKSIRANIVEGYGRRRYKADFVRFLVFAHASCDETIDHLDCLRETGSLADEAAYRATRELLDRLGGKLNRFILSVEKSHRP
jgi:four helix bundle protein